MNEKVIIPIFGVLFILALGSAFYLGRVTGSHKPAGNESVHSNVERIVELAGEQLIIERRDIQEQRANFDRERRLIDSERNALAEERIRYDRERATLDGDRHSVKQLDSLIDQTINLLEGK
jgi:hypothetical protein